MLGEFQLMWYDDLGCISVAIHCTELVDEMTQPVYVAPYCAESKSRDLEKIKHEKVMFQNKIETTQIKTTAPIVFASTKDETLRFCVGYRELHTVRNQASSSVSQIDDFIGSLGEVTIISSLDADSGCWQIELDEADRDKTTITSHFGLYRTIRVPVEL